MTKPTKKTISYYDYHECVKYLEDKYQFTSRGFLGFQKGNSSEDDKNQEYRDFWHWVVEKAEIVKLDCYFTMHQEWSDELDDSDWRVQILNLFLKEFGEPSKYAKVPSIYFRVLG